MAITLEQLRPRKENFIPDLVAGLTAAVVSIPDSIASAVLAGVNPAYAFNSIMVGSPIGALFTSSEFMNVSLTSAMMITVGSSLASFSDQELLPALVTLTILVGMLQLVFGFLKLGSLTKFISNAVMTGFLTGLAILIILGQLGDFTGYDSNAPGTVGRTVDLIIHPSGVDPAILAIGALTILTIVLLNRTLLKNFSIVFALIIASGAVLILGWETVELVGDTADVSGGLPTFALPNLELIPSLIIPAFSIALISLIQGAGVGQATPNLDGNYPDESGDFVGQGAANVATGFFSGLPVGGSLSATALNLSAGARSRWTNIFSGFIFAILIILFGGLVEYAAMAAIAAILIVAGFQTIDSEDFSQVWQTGWGSRLAMIITLVATLLIPIQYAVILGVFLSLLVYIGTSAMEVHIVELIPVKGGLEERPAPEKLESNRVTLLDIYGSLYFAAANTMEDNLPQANAARRAVVILRLRGRESIGSTFGEALERYNKTLIENGGKLMLCGVTEKVYQQFQKTNLIELLGDENIFPDSTILLYSCRQAFKAGERWLNEIQ